MFVMEILVGILLIVLLLIINGFMIVKALEWLDLDEDFRQAVRSWLGGRK
jgi:hypothetical protein